MRSLLKSQDTSNILQVPLTSQVLVQAKMKINRMLMQCTEQEDEQIHFTCGLEAPAAPNDQERKTQYPVQPGGER